MWSVLSEVEQPVLRVMLFACLIPLMWFALLVRIAFDAASARVRLRRK